MRRLKYLVLAVAAIAVLAGCGQTEKLRKENSALQSRLKELTAEKQDAQSRVDSLQGQISSLQSKLNETEQAKDQLNSVLEEQQQKRQELAQQRQELEKLVKNLSGISVKSGEKGNYIVLEDKILFDLGEATLNDQAKQSLDSIADYLANKTQQQIRIDGHTDGVPITRTEWQDNYHLSAMRAHAVFSYLKSKGIPAGRMHIAGFGPNKPRVEPPKPEAPVAKNRRVEILLMPKEENIEELLKEFK